MHLTSKSLAPALKALVEGLIDYAGMFPPAKLPVEDTIAKYTQYKSSEQAWMLHWFVVSTAELPAMPRSLDGCLTVLGTVDDNRAAALETSTIVEATRPVYCEVSPGNLDALDAVKAAGCFAKIRTGGVKPEAIPSPADVAAFITACAERRLPFKATAGLHHPIRAEYALTYEPDAPRAVMHGFLNVLMAAAFAWNGRAEIVEIVSETDPEAFKFDERAHWRNFSLSAEEVRKSRSEFLHSIGSCSFEEPVQELQKLGLM
ncbi:MAG: hypothetical protein K2W95_18635 [Candidatus Obscuribacterales bacterium]|nr:hypothetical protein [Candidatus Obscuribacterales bacterium]